MFLRTVKVKGHAYVRLVESYRQDGKVKQRYIANICSMEEFDLNIAYSPFVDGIADLLRDFTKLGDSETGTQKQKARMLRGRAEDLLESYAPRLKRWKAEHE